MKKIVTFALAMVFIGSFSLALAQGTNLNTGGTNLPSSPSNADGGTNLNRGGTNLNPGYTFEIKNPLNCPDLECVLGGIIRLLIYRVAPALVTFMVIVGAFQILTAAGNPEKFKKGRQTILYAAIGFAIILLAGSVGAIIQSLFEGGGSPGPGGGGTSSDYGTNVLGSGFDYNPPGSSPLDNSADYGYSPYVDLANGGDTGGSAGGGGTGSSRGTEGCAYYINPQDYCIQVGGTDCGRISKDGPPVCVGNSRCTRSIDPREYCERTNGADCASISEDGPRVCLN